MVTPGVVNVDSLIEATEDFANSGDIDPTVNMQNDKVYVFHGTADRTVYPGKFLYHILSVCFKCHILRGYVKRIDVSSWLENILYSSSCRYSV